MYLVNFASFSSIILSLAEMSSMYLQTLPRAQSACFTKLA